MKIALISCSKSKRNYRCKAKELYAASELFSVSYQYAKALNVDAIYILSAKHGLIHEDTLVDPYEFSMESLPPHRRIDWANYVKTQMAETLNPSNDTFVVLAGMGYLKPLLAVQAFGEYSFPLRGMRFGERIAFMNHEIERLKAGCFSTTNQCELLHKLFNQQKMYTYSQIDSIEFENGIYIVFEKGERYGQYNRIVRVGTHTASNRLKNRLRDHYIRANKDGSIFRKNIGKALLNRRHDGYLHTWNYDTSKPENKGYVDPAIQSKIEEEVSAYLQENTFFTVFEVLDSQLRLRFESGIIATLNGCEQFQKSSSWLGNDSTEQEIRDSGMWLKKGLQDAPLDDKEVALLEKILSQYTISAPDVVAKIPKVTTADVVAFVREILASERERGKDTCELVSGDIAKKMGVSQRMPMMCNAMRKVMGTGDEILYAPQKGNGTTLKIKYHL